VPQSVQGIEDVDLENLQTSSYVDSENREGLNISYQIIAARRMNYDVLLWQVPVLSLTAQSFLFQISLGSGINLYARLASSLLSLVAALISMQLMAKHRYHEQLDSKALELVERQLGLPLLHSIPKNPTLFQETKPIGVFLRMSSYKIWLVGLSLFALVATTILVYAIVKIIEGK